MDDPRWDDCPRCQRMLAARTATAAAMKQAHGAIKALQQSLAKCRAEASAAQAKAAKLEKEVAALKKAAAKQAAAKPKAAARQPAAKPKAAAKQVTAKPNAAGRAETAAKRGTAKTAAAKAAAAAATPEPAAPAAPAAPARTPAAADTTPTRQKVQVRASSAEDGGTRATSDAGDPGRRPRRSGATAATAANGAGSGGSAVVDGASGDAVTPRPSRRKRSGSGDDGDAGAVTDGAKADINGAGASASASSAAGREEEPLEDAAPPSSKRSRSAVRRKPPGFLSQELGIATRGSAAVAAKSARAEPTAPSEPPSITAALETQGTFTFRLGVAVDPVWLDDGLSVGAASRQFVERLRVAVCEARDAAEGGRLMAQLSFVPHVSDEALVSALLHCTTTAACGTGHAGGGDDDGDGTDLYSFGTLAGEGSQVSTMSRVAWDVSHPSRRGPSFRRALVARLRSIVTLEPFDAAHATASVKRVVVCASMLSRVCRRANDVETCRVTCYDAMRQRRRADAGPLILALAAVADAWPAVLDCKAPEAGDVDARSASWSPVLRAMSVAVVASAPAGGGDAAAPAWLRDGVAKSLTLLSSQCSWPTSVGGSLGNADASASVAGVQKLAIELTDSFLAAAIAEGTGSSAPSSARAHFLARAVEVAVCWEAWTWTFSTLIGPRLWASLKTTGPVSSYVSAVKAIGEPARASPPLPPSSNLLLTARCCVQVWWLLLSTSQTLVTVTPGPKTR